MAQIIRAAPQLYVRDVVETAHFYRDVLGFSFDRFFGEPPSFVVLDRDGARVLFKTAPASTSLRSHHTDGNGFTDIFFYVDDIAALAKTFAERGADILSEPDPQSDYDAIAMTVRDCNGYALTFSQLRHPSPEEVSWPPRVE